MENITTEKTWKNDYVKRLRAVENTVKGVLNEIFEFALTSYMDKYNFAVKLTPFNSKDRKELGNISLKANKVSKKLIEKKLNVYSTLINKLIYEPKKFEKDSFYKFTKIFLSTSMVDIINSIDFVGDIETQRVMSKLVANFVKEEKIAFKHFSKKFEGIDSESFEDLDAAIDFQTLAEHEIMAKQEARIKDEMAKEVQKNKRTQDIALKKQENIEKVKLAKEKSQALNKIRKDKNIGEKAEIKAVVNDKLATLIADAQDILKYGRSSEISSLISVIMLNADINQKNMPQVIDMSIQALEKKIEELDKAQSNIEEIFSERKPYISVADGRITEIYPAESF